MQSWSIIILNYEEVNTITSVVEGVLSKMKELQIAQFEIILIDDCSNDGSQKIIRELSEKYECITAIYNEVNLGIGKSTKKAHEATSNENVYLISADGEANLDELNLIDVHNIAESEFILFERSNNVNYGFYRHAISFLNRFLNFILFRVWIYDITWNKVIKREQIKILDLQLAEGLIDAEIVLKLLKKDFKLKRIKSNSNPRVFGNSNGGNSNMIINSILEIHKLWKTIRTF